MRLEQIAYFLSVAEHRNITAAAKALFISQPALSKQITLLEQEVGVQLFERRARGVFLTDAGEQFQHDLKNILRELENAKKNAYLAGHAGKRLLNIGCFDGVYTDDFLPDFYEYMKRAAMNQKLILHTYSFTEGLANLKKGRLDIWLTLSEEWEAERGFCVKALVHRNGALIYSNRSELVQSDTPAWEEFSKETCIAVKRSSSPGMYRFMQRNMRDLHLDPEHIEDVDNISTLLSYVKLGRGYSILSEDVLLGERELNKVILPPEMGVDVVAVWAEENEPVTSLMRAYGSENVF